MSNIFELSETSVIVCSSGLEYLQRVTDKISFVIWIPVSNDSRGVPIHILDGSPQSTCVINLGPLLTSGNEERNMLALNILSLSSLVVFEKVEGQSLSQFDFLRRILDVFGGDLNSLKSSLAIPPLVLFSHSGHVSAKESKKMLETYLAPEVGFSEEIGDRNLIRNVINTLFESREAIGATAPRGSSISDMFGTDELRSRLSHIPPMHFRSMSMNGILLSSLLRMFVVDGVGKIGPLTDDSRSQIEEGLLAKIEADAWKLYETSATSLNAKASSLLPSMDVLVDLRRRVLEEGLARHIFKWTPAAIATKKSLQRKIRSDMAISEARIREALAAHCRAVVGELESARGESVAAGAGSMGLGEGAQAYTDFLALKNAIEKNVSTYNSSVGLSAVVASNHASLGAGQISALYNGQIILEEQLNEVRSEVLREYIVSSLKVGLQKGEDWVRGFSSLLEHTEKRKKDMKDRYIELQAKEATLDRSISTHKTVSAETIRALTSSLSALRTKQSSEMEKLESEVQSLVDAVERTSRLNEKEKGDISEDLMDIQKRIQVAQSKALELRQQREEQSNTLHQNLLENEREGHKWIKSTYARQHDLLAEELRLERDLSKKKSEHMAQLFALEGEHIRQVEALRNMAQRDIEAAREDHFKRRELLARDRDATVSMLRRRNIELEAKLSAAGGGTSTSASEHDKGCSVM